MPQTQEMAARSTLAALGLRLSDWFERWFPDAFALALTAVAIVFAASVAMGSSVTQTAQWFGAGFWDLVAFTMQMSMIIVTGYAVATAPPVYAVVRKIAEIPTNGRNAAAFVGLFSMLASLVSWSFSLIFSGLLAREVARRVRGSDYRAIGAAAYLGVGSVWALGLSSSAALIMAAPASLPDAIEKISGVIPLSQTLGLWQSMADRRSADRRVDGALLLLGAGRRRCARDGGDGRHLSAGHAERRQSRDAGRVAGVQPGPDDRHLHARLPVSDSRGRHSGASVILELNHYVFLFLIVGMLLHWRPRSFVQAIAAAVAPVGGVLIQYPLYAGIVRMMTESGIATEMAHFFVAVSTQHTYPIMIGIYSAFLGLFIPSAGGKWLIEAPYMLEAAKTLEVHLGWVVQTYNATEALANLIHPFWMLPLVGILGLKARDIVGYSMLQFVVHVPLVLFLVWAFNYTLTYVPPGTSLRRGG